MKKEKPSTLFNITDLTNALKIDPSLLDKLNSPRMLSLDEFKRWMTEGINNVRSHPYKGAPKSVWMWLSDDGFQLRLDPLVYIALEGLSPYLSNPWNALDFTIVCLGWFTELPFISGVNFSAFRAFRALRALRTMQYLQGLREVVDTFIGTLVLVLVLVSCEWQITGSPATKPLVFA